MGLRCWQCGVEPTEAFEITSYGDAEPRYMAGRWPAGDHEHATQSPTPNELLAASDRAGQEQLRIWAA